MCYTQDTMSGYWQPSMSNVYPKVAREFHRQPDAVWRGRSYAFARWRLVRSVALAGLLMAVPWSVAAQLAPAVQADLYVVQTDAYLDENDYAAAKEAMGKIITLSKQHDLTLPDEFHFKYAQVLELAGEHEEAVASLTRYLELTGKTGQHYREALRLMHQAMQAEAVPEPGSEFRDCQQCPLVVVVPAGSYQMGSPGSEEARDDDEGPRHRVTIAKPFAVGVYAVTFAEWDACVTAGGCGGYRPDDEGWGRGGRPVINVSWDDTREYARWLSQHTGERYRLLSEAEWEYVARAGTTTPFHIGSTISTGQANYNGNYTYGGGSKGTYRARTVPVGTFAPNGFGLYEVHGNVWEWTQDCWNDSYVGAPADGSAWEQGQCGRRVLRGGSWLYPPRYLRSAIRLGSGSGNRDDDLGFRVARTLTP